LALKIFDGAEFLWDCLACQILPGLSMVSIQYWLCITHGHMLGKPEVQKFIFQLCWRDYFHFYCSLAKGLMRLCVEQGESRNKLQSWPPSIHHDSPVFFSIVCIT